MKGTPLFKRRGLLAATAATLAAGLLARPSDRGGAYSPYFAGLNEALKALPATRPRMMLDLDRVDNNIDVIREHIPNNKTWRIVVKSLPSMDLLDYIMQRGETSSLMLFHQPFLSQVAERFPDTDVLLGKPLPVTAAAKFYAQLGDTGFDPQRQLQWLIDSIERLQEYHQLARETGTNLRVNLEIDIGLHRGGFATNESLEQALSYIQDHSQHLTLAGFMGYEPFIAKLPARNYQFKRATGRYRELVDFARSRYPALFNEAMTYNTAGSQTYQLYRDDDFFNDICVGSGVVLPSDFDLPTVTDHQPAAFIATPVLKQYDQVMISGLEESSSLFALANPNRQQAFYIYGGNWLADYENPPGLIRNNIWGYS
ncbi:MAG: alanine racemase, partial [Gammaproteobacteria bacterium]